MGFQLKCGYVYSKNGLPISSLRLADGRLSVAYDKQGVSRLDYFMPNREQFNTKLFQRGIFDSFRCFVMKNGIRYSPNYRNVKVYPYGFSADWLVNEDKLKFSVYALNENLYFSLQDGEGYEFGLSFYTSTQFIPAFNGDFDSYEFDSKRTWKDWIEKNNCLCGGLNESKTNYDFQVGIVSNLPIRFDKKNVNNRWDAIAKASNQVYFAIIFEKKHTNFAQDLLDAQRNFYELLQKQELRYKRVVLNIPKLKTKEQTVDSFFALAPLYHESLKPRDVDGCVRAHTTRYWVWGWDTMIANTASFIWNDAEYIAKMLTFFKNTAHPTKGIIHSCAYDNTAGSFAVTSSQGIYITLAELYWQYTGDKEFVENIYPFIKQIFEKIITEESQVNGLFIGTSLFPDFPKFLQETGCDISLFNNTVMYVALRAMETLAILVEDDISANKARLLHLNAQKNFYNYFYDKNKGYFVNSIDANTLKKRNAFNICGYFWDSDYHFDLLSSKLKDCTEFILEHGISKQGFKTIPIWDNAYDAEANQLHCTWPAVEEIILRTLQEDKSLEKIQIWMNQIKEWTKKLTCPEGVSYLYDTDELELDRWNCESGIWQAYSARKRYEEILSIVCGISIDFGGITFASPQTTFELRNLLVLDYSIEIYTQGAGKEIDCIEVNGKSLSNTKKIPLDLFDKTLTNRIIVKLGTSKISGLIRAVNIKIFDYFENENRILFKGESLGTKVLHFHQVKEVLVDGKSFVIDENTLTLYFEKNKIYNFELII